MRPVLVGLAAVICVAALLGALRLNPYTAGYGDEARFLMVAQSLRFEGRYEFAGALGANPEHQYPPGLPAMLALVMWVSGSGQPLATAVPPAKAAVLALHLAGLVFLYDLLARRGPRWVALAAVLGYAVHPLTTSLATEPMTDIPFVVAGVFTLWSLQGASGVGATGGSPVRASGAWQVVAAGLGAGMAANLRLVGVVLIAVGGLYLLLQRRWRGVLIFVAVALLCLLPWLLHSRTPTYTVETGTQSMSDYVSKVARVDLFDAAAPAPALVDYAGRLVYNARMYTFGLGQSLLHRPWRELGFLPAAWGGKLDGLFGLALLALVAVGVAVCAGFGSRRREGARRGKWLLPLYAAALVVTLLAWPFVQQRYILPLLPFLWFFLLLGLHWLATQAGSYARVANVGVALFVAGSIAYLAALNLAAGWQAFSHRQAPDVASYYANTSSEWAHYFQAGRWLAQETPAGAIAMARKPYLIYLYEGRAVMPLLWSHAPEDWLAFLPAHGVEYVIEDAFTWSDASARFLRPVLRAYPQAFELVYETPPPTTRVWRFRDQKSEDRSQMSEVGGQ